MDKVISAKYHILFIWLIVFHLKEKYMGQHFVSKSSDFKHIFQDFHKKNTQKCLGVCSTVSSLSVSYTYWDIWKVNSPSSGRHCYSLPFETKNSLCFERISFSGGTLLRSVTMGKFFHFEWLVLLHSAYTACFLWLRDPCQLPKFSENKAKAHFVRR